MNFCIRQKLNFPHLIFNSQDRLLYYLRRTEEHHLGSYILIRMLLLINVTMFAEQVCKSSCVAVCLRDSETFKAFLKRHHLSFDKDTCPAPVEENQGKKSP